MPLFFIAYGLALPIKEGEKGRTFKDFVKKRFKGLMIPYLLWCLIYSKNLGIAFFKGVLYGTNQSLGAAETNQVLWFLPVMFLAAIFYFLINKTAQRFEKFKNPFIICCAVISGIISVLLKKFPLNFGLVFGIDIAFTGTVFMVTGSYLRKLSDIMIRHRKLLLMPIALILAVCGAFFAKINVPNDSWVSIMALGIYGKSYPLYILSAGISTFALTLFSIVCEKIRIFSWLGANSLVIMAVHYIIFPFTVKLSLYLTSGGGVAKNITLPLINSLFTLVICIPIILFINNFVPALNGKDK